MSDILSFLKEIDELMCVYSSGGGGGGVCVCVCVCVDLGSDLIQLIIICHF